MRNGLCFWIWYAKSKLLALGERILEKILATKMEKYTKKWPHCPYFDTQEVVLGEGRLGGANELQIQKFHLG